MEIFNYDYKVSEDLYIIKNEDSRDFGKIMFVGDSFYGEYTIAEFDELLCQLVAEFLKIRNEVIHQNEFPIR